ncbi:hypothetical protein [Wenjunlia tyrosinilytica]|uniref:Uncharacterized protein n=1 Tax=Wenjunlia tyrosinilytica TaxID=1544741 RepID=A0A917ZZJ7_9ACTN|nr:hypothetical protein [Wenjunlia tyrosinilytica]GGP00250.1 hypothetical protein GCM10012280_68590 [Wenjunlia tyrosinilytica]
MARWVRWPVTVVAAAVVFGGCLWVGRSVPFAWMPEAQADRWMVATAFATVVGTVAATAVGWWAGREQPAPPPPPASSGSGSGSVRPAVSQEATATGRARVNQVGGDQGTASSPAGAGGGGGPGRVEQKAQASHDASVTQVGGHQRTGRGDDDQQRRP